MGHQIILAYLEKYPAETLAEFKNIYTYFKFKAYLQTTLRCTRKAYYIKSRKTELEVSFLPPEKLYELSDELHLYEPPDSQLSLKWAIERLEPTQAEVIKLYYYVGKTDLEISRMRHVSRQAVNSLKRRALLKLRNFLTSNA